MSACDKGKEWEWAQEVFESMVADGIPGNTVTYTILMTACLRAGNCAQALCTYDQMRAAHVQPNLHTYNVLISVHQVGGGYD